MSIKPYLLNDVPEDLWEALRTDAASRETPMQLASKKRTERSGTSITNVVNEILARRYSVDFSPTNRATFDQAPINRSLYLRLPEEVSAGVKREAERAGHGQMRATIISALAEHYLLSVPHSLPQPKRKAKHGRPRGRKARA